LLRLPRARRLLAATIRRHLVGRQARFAESEVQENIVFCHFGRKSLGKSSLMAY
jgi:hypothetical protein